jgi:hypothetical protein
MKAKVWKYFSLIMILVMAIASIAAAPLDQTTQQAVAATTAVVTTHGPECRVEGGHWDKVWVNPVIIMIHGKPVVIVPGYWKPVWVPNIVCKPTPKAGCYIDKDWKEQCPKAGCFYAPKDDTKPTVATTGHKPPKPPVEEKPKEICPEEPYAYPNFQNDICLFCAPPDLTKLVSWDVQKPKDDNDVTIKYGGTRACAISDETHNGKNDAGFWVIDAGQWVLANGDYYAQSKFIDAFALKADSMCAVFTDPGKVGRTFHQGKLEKNGFFTWRGLPEDALLLSGAYCPEGEAFVEADLTSGKLHRARDVVDGKMLVDISKFTAPNGRPLWNER